MCMCDSTDCTAQCRANRVSRYMTSKRLIWFCLALFSLFFSRRAARVLAECNITYAHVETNDTKTKWIGRMHCCNQFECTQKRLSFFVSSRPRIFRVRITLKPQARSCSSFFSVRDAFSACSLHCSQLLAPYFTIVSYDQLSVHKYWMLSSNGNAPCDLTWLLCDRKLLICHFPRQMTRWSAQCAHNDLVGMQRNYEWLFLFRKSGKLFECAL